LVITTAIFTACVLTDFYSSLFSIYVFDVTMATIAVLALLSDIIIAPALLTWMYGRKDEKN
jgi:preprotein translocase subunit SecF